MITWTENGEPWKEESRYSYVTIDGDVITPELYSHGGRVWFCAALGSIPAREEVDRGSWPECIVDNETWSLAYVRSRWRGDPILPEHSRGERVWYSPPPDRVLRVDSYPPLTPDIASPARR